MRGVVAHAPPDRVSFDKMDWGKMFSGELQILESVRLAEGAFDLDGERAAEFTGVLEDANRNRVSGEGVRLEFTAGGATTLEAFLIENDFGILLGWPKH